MCRAMALLSLMRSKTVLIGVLVCVASFARVVLPFCLRNAMSRRWWLFMNKVQKRVRYILSALVLYICL